MCKMAELTPEQQNELFQRQEEMSTKVNKLYELIVEGNEATDNIGFVTSTNRKMRKMKQDIDELENSYFSEKETQVLKLFANIMISWKGFLGVVISATVLITAVIELVKSFLP